MARKRPPRSSSGAPLDVVILGLSITSSWGNGHATGYRGLVRALVGRGHRVLFLERDKPWYAENRDLPDPPWGRTELYGSVEELRDRFADAVARADLVMVGSYVPDGVEVGRWVQEVTAGTDAVGAFYDVDTPITLRKLEEDDREYLAPELVPGYALYLSFTGGPVLETLRDRWGSPRPKAFHCFYDPQIHYPVPREADWELGYMGTYSDDRQPTVEALLLEPARQRADRRFVVAGPGYPDDLEWPPNVERIGHLAPGDHADFYARQRYTLNVTRADMVAAGWSPSVRLFEAAGCRTPVISDRWPGIEDFFVPGEEVFLADDTADCLRILADTTDDRRRLVARRALERVRAEHTNERRAEQLEEYVAEVRGEGSPREPDRRATLEVAS